MASKNPAWDEMSKAAQKAFRVDLAWTVLCQNLTVNRLPAFKALLQSERIPFPSDRTLYRDMTDAIAKYGRPRRDVNYAIFLEQAQQAIQRNLRTGDVGTLPQNLRLAIELTEKLDPPDGDDTIELTPEKVRKFFGET